MILTREQWAAFDQVEAAQRWTMIEDYRAAEPTSATGRRRAVEDVLEHLCQQVHDALWVPGFDADAWAMLHHGQAATCRGTLTPHEPDQGAHLLTRLDELTAQRGWWPIFDHTQPDPFTLGRLATTAQAATWYSWPTACRACASQDSRPSAPAATWQRATTSHHRAEHETVVIDLRAPLQPGRLTA